MHLKGLSICALLHAISISQSDEAVYPTCGDCWCIPGDSGLGPCPVWTPSMNFSSTVVNTYYRQKPTWWYTLNCNPYYDATCTTDPPQVMLDIDNAVCAYVYSSEEDGSKSCDNYVMTTYSSREEALAAGAVVTHGGSCGLCSTTQDLALYLSKL